MASLPADRVDPLSLRPLAIGRFCVDAETVEHLADRFARILTALASAYLFVRIGMGLLST